MTRQQELFFNVPIVGEPSAEGVDFDGTNDYLSRSTDLVGNVDSKTFTFSAWVYLTTSNITPICVGGGVSPFFSVVIQGNGGLIFTCRNSTSTNILEVSVALGAASVCANNTWVHILISIDLANTANRFVFINDRLRTALWNTYTDDFIAFKQLVHYINREYLSFGKGRLNNVFLDYTYRDLSVEANRRIFITAEGKPAEGQKLLNPIIGMSMKDAATAHINDFGTGGNFTLNGTIATSNRGANQDNCVASYFDGSTDFLSKTTALTGVSNSKVFTVSFNYRATSFGVTNQIINFADGSTARLTVTVSTSGSLEIQAYNSSSTRIFYLLTTNGTIVLNKQYSISCSVDLANTDNRHMYINGVSFAPTWNTYTDDLVAFNVATYRYYIAASTTGAGLVAENLGELYFDTKYINLATSNPFWDAVENKAIPVRKVIANTGVTPLIAMPLDASNAGKNYGTGGDFTANSVPYVGARGASETWQRTGVFNGSTTYLSSTGLTGITDTKTITLVGHVYKTASTLYHLVGSTNSNVSISINASNQLVITAKNTAGTTILSATVTTAIANTTWTSILLSIDLSNTSNRSIYLNGASASVTWTTYTNDTIDFTNASWVVGADVSFGNKFAGSMSLMMDNTYIDFTSEVNRLKYIDGLSYPLSINSQVAKGMIIKPALYLSFEDTTNLGINSGYGGALTINGTLSSGADVLG